MNLLEAFYFSFSADTKGMQEGIDAGRAGAEQLNNTLGDTENAAHGISNSFIELAKSAGALIAGTLAFGAIKGMVEASSEATNALKDQARELRVNADTLNAWQKVAVSAGGTAEGLNATFKMLSERYRDPEKALMRIADRFKDISDLKADRLGASLGIDKGTVASMRDGAAGLQALIDHQKELSSVTQEDLDAADKFDQQLKDTNTVYDDVRRKIATEILPYMTLFFKLMERITVWSRDNKYFVLGFFGAIAAIITAAYLPAMIRAAVATWAVLAPYIAIGAAVAAVAAIFALAFDDIMNFLDGNKSVVGDLAKRWPIIGDIVHYIADQVKLLGAICSAIFGFITDTIISGPTVAMANLAKALNAIVEGFLTRFPALRGAFELFGEIASSVATGISNKFGDMLKVIKAVIAAMVWAVGLAGKGLGAAMEVGASVNRFFGGNAVAPKFGGDDAAPGADGKDGAVGVAGAPGKAGVGGAGGRAGDNGKPGRDAAALQIKQTVLMGQQQLAATNSPINAQTSNSISNSARTSTKNSNVKIDKIEVNTQATDAKGIAEGVGKSLSDAIKDAHDSFDDGVHA